MEVLQYSSEEIRLSLSKDELLLLNNTLNEVLNGVDTFEFQARLGVSRDLAAILLSQMSGVLDKI